MLAHKAWKREEDQVLCDLYENQKVPKWSQIAKCMADKHKMRGKTGKQCKRRYQQILQERNENLLAESWTFNQENRVNQLHNQFGNRWAMIAANLKEKNDNNVKNYFYSKLRKAIRHLNKLQSRESKQQCRKFKKIEEGVIYKIMQASDERFNCSSGTSPETINLSMQLKEQLYKFKGQKSSEQIQQLRVDIGIFNTSYKRKTKKQRRGSVQSENLRAVPKIDRMSSQQLPQSCDEHLSIAEEESIFIYEQKMNSNDPEAMLEQANVLQYQKVQLQKNRQLGQSSHSFVFMNLGNSINDNLPINSIQLSMIQGLDDSGMFGALYH